MTAEFIISGLVLVAVVTTIALGRRDGWLRLSASSGSHMSSALPGRQISDFNHVGIAQLRRFASVRRRVGYEVGNEIIRLLAQRLLAHGEYQVGRVGRTSIEFLYRADNAKAAQAMMQELQAVLEQPVAAQQLTYSPEIVIGSNPIRGQDATDDLFDLAAFAVEEASKRTDRIIFVEPDFAASTLSGDIFRDFAEALRHGALELHYLPKLKLADERIVGAEALSRWTHPRHGSVPPSTFVALAEETGLIGDLTLWSLDRAIADQRRLIEAGFPLNIDVNLSAQLVSDGAFCDLVRDRVLSAPGKVGLEITETAVIENPQAALANLRRLVEAGIHLAIDDFGSGLSSLAYLRDLPAHELKIDQGFVRNLTTNNRDPLLVRSAIEIAHALDMEVTAEGVEDALALGLLKVMRCTNAQGYHISAPLPLDLLIEYLRVSTAPAATEVEHLRVRLQGGRS